MSQKTPPRTKDFYIIRSDKKKTPYGEFHITEIVGGRGYKMKGTALCTAEVNGKPHPIFKLNGVTCPTCQETAQAMGLIDTPE